MEEDQKLQQEVMFKLSMFEQKMQHIQQQLNAIDESTVDLGLLSAGLDEIQSSVGKDILAPMGRGIFVNAKLSSEKLIVDVGGKNLVAKSVPETKELIAEQLEKLKVAKETLLKEMENSEKELNAIFSGSLMSETEGIEED